MNIFDIISGAIFAAWPQLYAVSFSGFYLAMFAILVALILRPVAFKFRGKRDDAADYVREKFWRPSYLPFVRTGDSSTSLGPPSQRG